MLVSCSTLTIPINIELDGKYQAVTDTDIVGIEFFSDSQAVIHINDFTSGATYQIVTNKDRSVIILESPSIVLLEVDNLFLEILPNGDQMVSLQSTSNLVFNKVNEFKIKEFLDKKNWLEIYL
jgi:hypothetical protein